MSYYYLLVKSPLFIDLDRLGKDGHDQIDININDVLTIDMRSTYPVLFEVNGKPIPKVDATFNRKDNMPPKGLGWSISSLIRIGDLIDITKGVERDKKINDLLG